MVFLYLIAPFPLTKDIMEKKGRHIITTKIEDFPVLHSARTSEKRDFEATYLTIDEIGRLNLNQLQEAIRS